MANPEHLAILKKGVEAWNDWRKSDPQTIPQLEGAVLNGAVLRGVNFGGSNDYAQSKRVRTHSGGTALDGVDLRGADLTDANLDGAVLIKADLRGATFYRARLQAWFAHARLNQADLSRADLSWAMLSGADLSQAVLRQSNLSRAILDGADFTDAIFEETDLGDVDLRAIKGLETIRHHGPSAIGVGSIYRSEGTIPESFLRGAGVPENFITFMKSLSASAFQFFSAFISYSSKDQELADRIYPDLQAKGVRCWLATEDLKIGDPFRQRIDESIKLHDKLLLILSEHSVQCPWVEDEVNSALDRERRENRSILFPIRIDDAVIDTDRAWAKAIQLKRHIGDFTRWKDHDAYQKAFERLLRDLKAEGKGERFVSGPGEPLPSS